MHGARQLQSAATNPAGSALAAAAKSEPSWPAFATAATPGFFYLVLALPKLVEFRTSLMDLGLWSPPTSAGKALSAAAASFSL